MKKLLFTLIAIVFLFPFIHAQDYRSYPMWNANLPLEQRVNDLVGRLTLEEKVAQMLNTAPAIPRLGIPAYDWWNETLHGVARTPFPTTSFPQAIGMAATWDTASLRKMGDISATEGRAIHNRAIEENKTGNRYWGLTYWTPNINIFRDPRWGRGQETYGEDPYLTGVLGTAFVHGLQGDNPRYLKAAACAKHFAVHSGPEPSRHADNFDPTPFDLWDTYLPAFKTLVTQAKVAGVMCAYNAIYKQPCCGNDLLMTDILRNQWKFTGYVTSDCGAIDDFFRFHKTHKDAMSSAVDAVVHGTDVECGHTAYLTLVNAVKSGMIKEDQINISVRRLFEIRYRLGMFDPPEMVPYARTPMTELESPAHKAHALKMARQSIVLLKNQNQALPLSKSIKKIAVLGPNASNKISVLGNYNGFPSKVETILEGIREKLGRDVEVIYEQAVNFTNDTIFQNTNLPDLYTFEGAKGVRAEFFNNPTLKGTPDLTRTEKDFDMYWTEGESPAAGISKFNFSARYSTTFIAPKDERLHFEARGNYGYRIFINDSMYVNAWERSNRGVWTFALPVRKGNTYKIRVEYVQGQDNGEISLRNGEYLKSDFNALVQKLKDVDAIIFAGGISPQLEGEEMPVRVPGFKGGDRTSIQLPAVQTELLKSLKSTGKPIVFVMMTGSALAIPWEDNNIPAILNAWYGGQSAGTAVADVLFGDYNPAGRLPVTFYKSDADLPDFSNYSMKGRTYRYFKGQPLYPFGFGLSYTNFRYDHLTVNGALKKGKTIKASIKLTNTGKRAGEEVVQLYIQHDGKIIQAPVRALKAFRRLSLSPGESRTISFEITPEDLSLIDVNGNSYQPKGTVTISIGGGQPGMSKVATSNVVSKSIKILK